MIVQEYDMPSARNDHHLRRDVSRNLQTPASSTNVAGSISKWFQAQDKFGRGFGLKMDSGKGAMKTHVGTLCTCIWVAIMIAYGGTKIDTLINKKGISILTTNSDMHFKGYEEFDYAQGLNFAVAFTGYDSK